MKIYSFLSRHPVYTSLYKVFSYIGNVKIENKRNVLLKLKTKHVEQSKLRRDGINIIKSPLIDIGAYKLLFKKYKAFIFAEYFERTWFKDFFVSMIFNLFKRYPFIALTKRTKYFLEKNKLNVFFIPPGIKPNFVNKKRKYILYVSRLIDVKNPLLVLKIAEKMLDEKFVIIGKGPLEHDVKKIIKKLKNVEYINYIKSREKLLKIYENAKLLIHPAKKDPIGFVVIEALSRSTPALTTVYTGASDYLPNEWKMKTFDLHEWIKKIRSINNKDTLKAKYIFKKEHLDINNAYYKKIAERIKEYIMD